jgi:hypothetical protein
MAPGNFVLMSGGGPLPLLSGRSLSGCEEERKVQTVAEA